MTPRYNSVILDVDSTLAALEGIDWLAAQRGPDVVARVAALTDRAMQGEIALESVYAERLALVRPGRAELAALADAYVAATVPGAKDAVARLREAGVRVALVSGGIRQSILPLARSLGVAPQDVHAVDVVVDMGGQYFAFDAGSPLATQTGKRDVATALLSDGGLPRPALADAYAAAVVPGAAEAIVRLREAGVRVALISGGIRQSIIPFARSLGLAPQDVHAVDVVVDMGGQYFAFDAGSPLATQGGKRDVAAALLADGGAFPRPALAVGDGATDLAMKGVADAFAAFTAVVRREPVVRDADLEIASFDQLLETVLA